MDTPIRCYEYILLTGKKLQSCRKSGQTYENYYPCRRCGDTALASISRDYYPKQFIQLNGHSLFQETCERAARLSKPDEIYIVTNEIHRYLVVNQVDELGFSLPDDHILPEPAGKNTLPAIAWAMQRIRRTDPSATAVVFPSDHLLGDDALPQIQAAEPLTRDYLVTFGVRPTSPHTGYGYIKPGKPLPPGSIADEFREKPDAKTAEQYVSKGYLWNSGIFLLSVPRFFAELKTYSPGYTQRSAVKPIRIMHNFPGFLSITVCWSIQKTSPSCRLKPTGVIWAHFGHSMIFPPMMNRAMPELRTT